MDQLRRKPRGSVHGLSRRQFHAGVASALVIPWLGQPQDDPSTRAPVSPAAAGPVPVVNVTDLYHPHQDFGDNFDLITAFALPEIDLRAVILDISAEFRRPVANPDDPAHQDREGPRDPGFIPVHQLNYLFNRHVPAGVAPFDRMRSPEDPMTDAPRFQQGGIDLLLRALDESDVPVEIVSFGSARPLAVAYNREPGLLGSKVARIHLCAGSSSPSYQEWNVYLDPHAFVRLLRSDLPVAIHPCATAKGPFAYGPHNCFWRLPDLSLVKEMDPALVRYLVYAASRSGRIDFLRAMDEDPAPDLIDGLAARRHRLWETGVWALVSGRKLVRRAGIGCRLAPVGEVLPADELLPNELLPCRVDCAEDGTFRFELGEGGSNKTIYHRGDPLANEAALREALPALYTSFRSGA